MSDDKRGVNVTIRMPPDLHARLEATAERETRSLSNMIVVLLTEALEARKQKEKE